MDMGLEVFWRTPMSSGVYQRPLKSTANMAAADTYDTAAALTERPAAFVSFRWHQPSLPPSQNVNSADLPAFPAGQFSGNSAICAINAVTTAISVTV